MALKMMSFVAQPQQRQTFTVIFNTKLSFLTENKISTLTHAHMHLVERRKLSAATHCLDVASGGRLVDDALRGVTRNIAGLPSIVKPLMNFV